MITVGRGRYRLEERIAAGGVGEVWRGTDTSLGRTVAIKVLRPNMADDERFRQRFAAEAQHAASLHDPHIATIFDYGDEAEVQTTEHSAYLVMEFVDGVPMSDLMSGPIEPRRAATLLAQVARGLAAAHAAGIVHRDVKPANLIVRRDGHVKITDFGLSRARGAAALTDTGTIMGTPHYLAPEIAEGRDATPASDIYSLGVVLYEALSGGKPFDGQTPIAVALAHLHAEPRPLPTTLPAALRSLVESAMARDPGDRPASASDVAAALQDFADRPAPAAPSPAPRMSATQVLPLPRHEEHRDDARPGAGRRSWRPFAAAAAVVVVLGTVAYTSQRGDHPAAQLRADQLVAQRPTTAPQSSPTTNSADATGMADPPGVTVDPQAYVGQPARDVEKELKELGLHVDVKDIDGGDKGLVAGIHPGGTVPAGQEVTMSVYKGEHPPHRHDEHGKTQHNHEED